MSSRLNPYISFNGNAREALEFYRDVFGGSLSIHKHGEFGDPTVAWGDQVMHGQLETDNDFTLMASDVPPGVEVKTGNHMVVSLSGDDGKELRDYWEKLSRDGKILTPLEKQVWGDEFGMCTDRFGITWMVNISE